MKECYVKCVSNKQAQALRPHLVDVGFVDAEEWNSKAINTSHLLEWNYILFYEKSNYEAEIHCHDGSYPHLYTLTADADLSEAAKTIRELYENQPQQ